MSETALYVLVAAAALLVLVLVGIVRSAGKLEPGQQPDNWEELVAAQYWTQEADRIRDYGLEKLRATGKAWAASIAALLGVLSTAAFVAGPKDLVKDVGGTEALVAAGLILGAAALSTVALLLATLAEQGAPQYTENLSGWALKSLTEQRATQAANQIRQSRYLVLIALVMIIGATAIAWLTALTGDDAGEKAQKAIVVGSDVVACGTLTQPDGALRLKVGDGAASAISATKITVVTDCP